MQIDRLLSATPHEAAREIAAALDADGHLLLTGSRLATVAAALESWTAFAALPLDIRQRFHKSVEADGARGGWMLMREHPVYTSHMREAELATAAPKQEYGFSTETDATLWPGEATAPGFARDARAVAALMDEVSRALLRAFSVVLGEEPGFLRRETGYIALKHYPGLPRAAGGAPDTGLDEHSDADVFTLLAQSSEALQIRGRDGSWITVPADPSGILLVNPGDWMELFSNGLIPAVRHRVLDTEVDRTSFTFFQGLAPMPVGPLARFVGAEGPRYPTVASDIPYTDGGSGVPRWQTAPEARAFAAARAT